MCCVSLFIIRVHYLRWERLCPILILWVRDLNPTCKHYTTILLIDKASSLYRIIENEWAVVSVLFLPGNTCDFPSHVDSALTAAKYLKGHLASKHIIYSTGSLGVTSDQDTMWDLLSSVPPKPIHSTITHYGTVINNKWPLKWHKVYIFYWKCIHLNSIKAAELQKNDRQRNADKLLLTIQWRYEKLHNRPNVQ